MKHFQSNKNLFLSKTAMLGPMLLLFLLFAFVVSCGDGSAGPSTDTTDYRTIYSGFIFDSAVGGLGYDCGNGVVSTNGLTESTGKFYYPTSAACTLSLGKVTIASFSPANTADLHYTPYDIWADDALSAARLLQTLDGSGNLDDGIQIPATLANVTGTIDLSKDLASAADNPGVTEALNALGKTTADLVSETDATAHFQSATLNLAADAVKIKTFFTSKEQINLPSKVTVGASSAIAVAVTWSSSDSSCVSDTGQITASSPARCGAGLTGSFKYESASKTKTFQITYDGNAKDYGDFIVSDAYIDFHTYRGDVIIQVEGDQEVGFVVSASNQPPDRKTIDSAADIERRFVKDDDDLGMRRIYLGWTDKFTYASAMNKRNISIPYNDSAAVPYLILANTDYYLHIYYKVGGVDKTISHPFKTPAYPKTATEAEALFPGTSLGGLAYYGSSHRPEMDIERKLDEPLVVNIPRWELGRGTWVLKLGDNDTGSCTNEFCTKNAYISTYGFIGLTELQKIGANGSNVTIDLLWVTRPAVNTDTAISNGFGNVKVDYLQRRGQFKVTTITE